MSPDSVQKYTKLRGFPGDAEQSMEKSECSSGYVECIGETEGGSVKRVENNKSVFRKKNYIKFIMFYWYTCILHQSSLTGWLPLVSHLHKCSERDKRMSRCVILENGESDSVPTGRFHDQLGSSTLWSGLVDSLQ